MPDKGRENVLRSSIPCSNSLSISRLKVFSCLSPFTSIFGRNCSFMTSTSLSCKYVKTYVHNWPLQPFNQDYDLASHTTYIRCVSIFIFSFCCLTWCLNSDLTSNKPTHYLLDYGDSYLLKFVITVI